MSDQRVSVEELGRALAEPRRLRILQELLGGAPLPAGALAARIGVAPSTVSGHLARLEAAAIVRIGTGGHASRAWPTTPWRRLSRRCCACRPNPR